jgi:hypothetical protein
MTPATREASETARADNRCSRRSGQWFTAIPDAFFDHPAPFQLVRKRLSILFFCT